MTELAVIETPSIAPVIPLRRPRHRERIFPARCRRGGLVHYTGSDPERSICGRHLRHREPSGTLPTCIACLRLVEGSLGMIYLLHFDEPFGHARHYCGWSSDVLWRLRCHTGAAGSNLMRHVNAAGIGWLLAGVWPGTRHDERSRHNRGAAGKWCPECAGTRTGPRYGVTVTRTTLDDGTPYPVRSIELWTPGGRHGG